MHLSLWHSLIDTLYSPHSELVWILQMHLVSHIVVLCISYSRRILIHSLKCYKVSSYSSWRYSSSNSLKEGLLEASLPQDLSGVKSGIFFFSLSSIFLRSLNAVYMWLLSHFGCFWLLASLWTVVGQVPLSMRFSRQVVTYPGVVAYPPPGNLPDSRIKPTSPESKALKVDSLPAEPSGKPKEWEKMWRIRHYL